MVIKFHLVHFVGVQTGDTTVGVEGTREVAGGVLSLTTTAGENAYSGLIGDPGRDCLAGIHGTYSPLAVVQALKIPVWSQALRIKIDGNWDRSANKPDFHLEMAQ